MLSSELLLLSLLLLRLPVTEVVSSCEDCGRGFGGVLSWFWSPGGGGDGSGTFKEDLPPEGEDVCPDSGSAIM